MIVEYGDEILFSLAPASRFYDIGGQFALVSQPLRNQRESLLVTPQTLADSEAKAAAKGAVAFVFSCPVEETQFAATLREQGYTVAECHYTGAPTTILPNASPPELLIRPANPGDTPQIMAIWERKREQYQACEPVFWRKAPTPPEWFASEFAAWASSTSAITLVAEQHGVLRGYLSAYQKQYSTQYGVIGFEHFAVRNPQADWPTVGAALLAEAGRLACERNIIMLRIVSGDADRTKCAIIESLGYARIQNDFVKVFIEELPPHPLLPWDEVK